MTIIPIDKNLIPYNFDIVLNNRVYNLFVTYNKIYDFMAITLSLGDETLVRGEKMVLNREMFRDLYDDMQGNLDERYPNDIIIPLDPSLRADEITFDNFGESTYLFVATRSELGI